MVFRLQLQLQDERQLHESGGAGLKKAQAAIRICLGGRAGQGVLAGKNERQGKRPYNTKTCVFKICHI